MGQSLSRIADSNHHVPLRPIKGQKALPKTGLFGG